VTTFFDKKRKKWSYEFVLDGKRFGPRFAVHPVTKALATTKREADAAEEAVRVAARMAPKIAPANEISLSEVIAALMPKWLKQKRAENIEVYVREIRRYFGDESAVADCFTQIRVDDFVTHMETKTIVSWHGGPVRDSKNPMNARFWIDTGKCLSPRTINLYLEILGKIIERAAKLRDPITNALVLGERPDVPHLRTEKRKPRPVPEHIILEIQADLPQHALEALNATLLFGFRRGEIFRLTIADVDFERGGIRLRAENVKDKEDEFLNGNTEAMAYMRRLVDQAKARGAKHLITFRRGKNARWLPIKKPKSSWDRVMALVEDRHGQKWRWHDLRAAFITHIALTAGAVAAQKVARHADYATTALYVDVADNFKLAAAEKATDRPALRGLNSPPSPSKESQPRGKVHVVKTQKTLINHGRRERIRTSGPHVPKIHTRS
jgi:integrase